MSLSLDSPLLSGLDYKTRRLVLDTRANWLAIARPKQIPPRADGKKTWMIKAGRGFGKTRPGAEETWWAAWRTPGLVQHVIAPTRDDLKFYCMDGVSGILNTMPTGLIERDGYNKSDLTIRLRNGSFIRGFSADTPNRMRGPQCHRRWNDELAAWSDGKPNQAWNMAEFGTRLPGLVGFRNIVTTTPRPISLIRNLVTDPTTVVVGGSTYENRTNLDPSFFDAITKYEGTVLGRQEIYGDVLEDELNGIIQSDWFKLWPNGKDLPDFDHVFVSLDTAFTERTTRKDNRQDDPGADPHRRSPDPTACSIWGTFIHQNKPAIMLLDCWEDYLGFPELVKRARKEMDIEYGNVQTPLIRVEVGPNIVHNSGKRPDVMIIEDKGSGISLRQALEGEGLFPYKYNPGKADKLQRLHAVSHIAHGGFVWVPEGKDRYGQPSKRPRTWAIPLIEQMCTFGGDGTIPNDDLMDTATQALRYFADQYHISTQIPTRQGNPDDEPVPVPRMNPYAA